MDAIIGASRVKDLEDLIAKKHPYPHMLKSIIAPGKPLSEIQGLAYDYLEKECHDPTNTHIYYVAGLCDITYKEKEDFYRDFECYEEVLIKEVPYEINNRVCDLINSVSAHTLYYGAKPCFATIPPISIETWNTVRLNQGKTSFLLHHQKYPEMQDMLNEAVFFINRHITEINESHNMATPDLEAAICEKRAGKATRVHYTRFVDGVHPTDRTQKKWAKKLLRAIVANRHFDNQIDLDDYTPSASVVDEFH